MRVKFFSFFRTRLRTAMVYILMLFAAGSFAAIRYVKPGGSSDGSSWANASGDLQAMINASAAGDMVWVAAGTYTPTQDPLGNASPADPRDRCFYLKNGVKVYGSFAGTESDLSQRNIDANPTILSGDFSGNDVVSGSGASLSFSNNGENAYHVVVSISDGNTTVLDGFTIKGGNANGSGGFTSESLYYQQYIGAGVMAYNASLAIRNCTVIGNNAQGSPSGGGGGAFYFLSGSPQLENCTIMNNNAGTGGGFNGNYCTATIKNTVLYGNKATFGGAVQIENNGTATFTNCTVTQNSTLYGVLFSNNNASFSIVNSIIWNNSYGSGYGALINGSNSTMTATYSILQNQCCISGTGLIFGQDPGFVNAGDPAGPDGIHRTADDGLSILSRISPAINAGNPATTQPPTDITGFTRIGTFDLGAYEMRNPCPSTRFYVKPVASGTGDGSSWADATSDLQSVINECGFEVWVAAGTYKPTCDASGNCNPADPRDRTFRLWSGARVYGGFIGTETNLSQRNPAQNQTILSGDFNGDDVLTPAVIGFNFSGTDENAYKVVAAIEAGPSTVLDGFTITGGGNGPFGGGMFVEGSFFTRSEPTVNACIFFANQAESGGGMYSNNSSARVTNCLFWGNLGILRGGGHFNFDTADPTFSNCTFVGNRALYDGGAIFNLFYGNLTIPTYSNCIVWGNESGISDIGNPVFVNNSIVQNGHPGSGNLIIDPQFVDAANGDFRVQICSPAIDAGNNDAIAGSLYDLNFLPRRYNNNTVDIGAFEFQASSIIPIIYSVAGGGSECEGNTIEPVTLSGSQTDIDYQWKIDGANQGSPVPGTGGELSFGPLSAGQYTVVATSIDGCTKVMDGLANVAFGEFTLNLVSVNGITGEPMTLIPNPGNIFQNIEWRLNGEPVATGTSNTFTPEECGTWTAFATNFTGCTTLSNELEILTRWYADADADGFGNPAIYQDACTQPAGYVPNREDCDDSNNAVNPGALEICNDGIDNNCDGKTLEYTAPTVAPSSVTGCPGDIATLSVSSPLGAIQWFDAPSGGNMVATGREIGLTLQTSMTLYAQSPPLQHTSLAGVNTAAALAVAEHNTLTGDDGRGIAVTPDYVFYTGDNNTVRYDHNLQNGIQLPRIDGMFSDLASGRLYAFQNGSGFAQDAIDRIQPLDAMGQPDGAPVLLSQSLTNLTTTRSIVFNGFGYVLFYDHTSKDFFRIALPSGNVTVIKEDYEIADHRIAETYWSWYMSEFDGVDYSVVYRVQGQQLLVRVNLTTEQKDTVATFADIGNDAAQFVFSPWDNRLFVHNEGRNFYNDDLSGEWMFAFEAANLIQCSEAPRTLVAVTVNACNANTVFSGTIKWEHNGTSGVQNATVNLTGAATGNDQSDIDGYYEISIPSTTGNFTLKPVKNTNKLNGLTSADVTAIQQHVTIVNPLPAPFKRIAADVNKSNSISTLDATLINQALLGNPQANAIFNTSWRFVPASYTFPNPNVPWGFPEQIVLTGVNGNVSGQDFKGIKLGDVATTWANPANFGAGEPLVFRVQDRVLEAGSEVTAEFRADQLNDLNSFQFALHFDPEQLQLVEIEPLAGLPVSMENFGTYNVAEGEIRVVWSQAASLMLGEAAPVFRLRFKALQSGARLSEVLRLNYEALPGHVYNSKYAESGVELRYSAATGTEPGLSGPALTLENQPNPFVEVTTLQFMLPEAGEAELRISDATGRLLFSQKKTYTAGRQQETLRLEGVSGVLFAELVTERGSVARKMVAVKN